MLHLISHDSLHFFGVFGRRPIPRSQSRAACIFRPMITTTSPAGNPRMFGGVRTAVWRSRPGNPRPRTDAASRVQGLFIVYRYAGRSRKTEPFMLFEHYQVSRACTRLAFPRCHEHVGAEKGLWIPAAARKTGEASGEDRDANALTMPA